MELLAKGRRRQSVLVVVWGRVVVVVLAQPAVDLSPVEMKPAWKQMGEIRG